MRAIPRGTTSNLIRFLLKRADTGAPFTGLAFDSAGLRISTIADVEAAATAYTAAGSTIETIETLGTYAAPTATKCRFREVDPTNHAGLYELQFADARFAVPNSKRLVVTVGGVSNLNQSDYEIQLDPVPSTSNVAAAVLDALDSEPLAELPIGNPPTNPTAFEALMLLYMAKAFGGYADRKERSISNAAGETIAVGPVSYQGARATLGKLGAPPEE